VQTVSVAQTERHLRIQKMYGDLWNDRRGSESRFLRACDTTGTRCAVTGIASAGAGAGAGAGSRYANVTETQSRSNEKIIYLPGYISAYAFRARRCIRSSRSAFGSVRIHRGKASGHCNRQCIHQYASASPCRRAIKSCQITARY
jgi:hypothetical protein